MATCFGLSSYAATPNHWMPRNDGSLVAHVDHHSLLSRSPPHWHESLGLHSFRIHPEDLPVMPIEIVKAPAIHETVVLRIHGRRSSGGLCLIHQLVDLCAAVARE